MLYPVKISFKSEAEMKYLPFRQKQNYPAPDQPYNQINLQEILKASFIGSNHENTYHQQIHNSRDILNIQSTTWQVLVLK